MAILREPVVIPTRLAWLGLLVVIGVLGFVAQILLTMGFQRETAGRASMALYTQVGVCFDTYI
jgi:drug/metabolite transporter (DMT)-like permease